HPVCDERRERVEDVAALLVDEATELRQLEALKLLAAFPIGEIAVVTGVGIVHLDRDARRLDQPPKVVELGQRGGARGAVPPRHRRWPDQYRSGPVVQAPLELFDTLGGIAA